MHFDYEDFGTVLSWKRDSWFYIQLGCMPSFHCTKESRRSERIKKEDWLEKRIGRTLDLSEKRTQSLFFMDLSESRQRTDCSFSLQGVRHRRYSVAYLSHDKVRIFEMWPRRLQNRTVFQLSRLEWNHRLKSTLDRLEIWVEGPLVMEIISPISAGRCQNGKIMSSYAVASRQKNILFCCCLWLITHTKKSSKDGNQGWLLGSKRNLKLDSRRSGEASSLSLVNFLIMVAKTVY